ncbi:hypothetical protein EON66_09445 [archaeon]|nr:MAG: hypothetical protein EON66_09445 [archaeon]
MQHWGAQAGVSGVAAPGRGEGRENIPNAYICLLAPASSTKAMWSSWPSTTRHTCVSAVGLMRTTTCTFWDTDAEVAPAPALAPAAASIRTIERKREGRWCQQRGAVAGESGEAARVCTRCELRQRLCAVNGY